MAEEINHDSITNLTHDILNQILSLIPLKEAARTIVLSSSWKLLWPPIHLNFNLTSDQQAKHVISSFLSTYRTTHASLNLSLSTTPFLKAIKGLDQELLIDFHGQKSTPFTSLSIELPLCDNALHLPSLKTLHLRSITGLAGAFLPALFSGCRNLETLSLEKCSGLQDIELKAHDLLRKFMVLDCENVVSVTISAAPNLKSFVYRGTLVKIDLQDTSNLCEVTVDMKDGTGQNGFDCEDVVSFLGSLKDVEVLTLSGWLLEWLCAAGVIFNNLDFKFNKLKEFLWIDCSLNKPKIDSLDCFLNITPSLAKLFIKVDDKCISMPSPHFHYCWHESRLCMDFAVGKPVSLQLKHLKLITIFGFEIRQDNHMLISLMNILLEKAVYIKKMILTSPGNNLAWRVAKIPGSHWKMISSWSSRTSCYSSESSMVLSSENACYFLLTKEYN